jgi:hypothetical protein
VRVYAAAVLLLLLPAAPGSQSRSNPDLSTRAVVDAAATYVKDYQRLLTSVLADETYRQEIINQVPLDAAMPRSRTMSSEMFFMFAPEAEGWMAIRSVSSIDGTPVAEHQDPREALGRLPASQVARLFETQNARFNIGRVLRNFNEPTFSLLVVDPNHKDRFRFDRKRIDRSGSGVLVTLAFAERHSPTLIRGVARGNVFTKGELTVEAETGRVTHAFLTGKLDSVRLELTTAYAPDERLGIWVPSVFRERYEYGAASNAQRTRVADPSIEYEHILCEARYTNFRRFETGARIIRD